MAFISNGYVYHTKYDNAEGIPSGSIQRAGDNVFNLIKSLVNSPYLEEPAEYKHGNLVFFDILGTFVVHYPKRLGVLLNNLTSFVVIMYIMQRLVRKKFSSMKGKECNLSKCNCCKFLVKHFFFSTLWKKLSSKLLKKPEEDTPSFLSIHRQT